MDTSALLPASHQQWSSHTLVLRGPAPAAESAAAAFGTSRAAAGGSGQPASAARGLQAAVVDAELALRRQRRRANMARYRQKQNDRAIHLEKEVRLLREEIQKLELQYDSVAAQLLTETTPWNFGAEFFRLFRHGSPALVPTDLGRLMYTPSGQVQRDFLQAMMAPDVQYGTACGVDIILEVWRQCAFIHQDYDILLDRLEHGDGNSIIATTTCTAIITVSSLRHGFPHLIRRDREGNWSPLVDLLLGQQLVVRGTTRFTWDEKKTCVVSVDYTADLLTPILGLLGNLVDVSRVFEEALVTPEGKFLAVE